jgi:hypothetical protein
MSMPHAVTSARTSKEQLEGSEDITDLLTGLRIFSLDVRLWPADLGITIPLLSNSNGPLCQLSSESQLVVIAVST